MHRRPRDKRIHAVFEEAQNIQRHYCFFCGQHQKRNVKMKLEVTFFWQHSHNVSNSGTVKVTLRQRIDSESGFCHEYKTRGALKTGTYPDEKMYRTINTVRNGSE